MKILVTGGAGFIGSHTADALIQKGHKVKILDNLHKTVHPKGKPSYINSKAEFIEGDVRDKKTFKHALDGVDAVFHFAAYQGYLPDFSTYFHVNSVSTALLYEILVEMGDKSKVKKVIVATSQAVMGEGLYNCPNCFPEKRSFIYPEIRLEGQLSGSIPAKNAEPSLNGSHPTKPSSTLVINTLFPNIPRSRSPYKWENDTVFLLLPCVTL